MYIDLQRPYRRRPVRFLQELCTDGWRLKVYGICADGAVPNGVLVDAGMDIARRFLHHARTRHTVYGIGFLGIHDGFGENQVFLDRWCNENELLHDFWVSPKDDPAALIVPDRDHNSVCVWDLSVQCFERTAWVECVLNNPRGPDVEAYFTRRLDGEI